MKKHSMHNGALVLLSLLLLASFSIHADCRASSVMLDDMEKTCLYSDCGNKGSCWCCVKNKHHCYPGRDQCLITCPIIT
ncbi:unnamed protein product [Urochloa decumbens]|uniref:Meg domain-containing protein n=1 Tax=Urochloa decumbens TaxID=240449 RepID=A0ABC9DI03_9POAL